MAKSNLRGQALCRADQRADARVGDLVRFEQRNHLVGPGSGGEFTLCGIAFDAGDSESTPELIWRSPDGNAVTCASCIAVIDVCRGRRVLRLD